MAQQGRFLLQIFPTTLYCGARIRTHVTSVSRVAPGWDFWRSLYRLSHSAAAAPIRSKARYSPGFRSHRESCAAPKRPGPPGPWARVPKGPPSRNKLSRQKEPKVIKRSRSTRLCSEGRIERKISQRRADGWICRLKSLSYSCKSSYLIRFKCVIPRVKRFLSLLPSLSLLSLFCPRQHS